MSVLWSRWTARSRSGLAELRQADWTLLLHVILFASAVPVLMRLSVKRLQRLLEPSRPPAGAPPEAVAAVVHHLALARRFGSPMVGSGCLTRGLTLYYFLRRSGLDVSLCFGMTRVEEGTFAGHCWLSHDGRPLLEPTDPRLTYVEIFSMPHAHGSTCLSTVRDLAGS